MFVVIDLFALVHPFVNSSLSMDRDDINDWVSFFGNPMNFLPETPLGSPMDFYPILVSDEKCALVQDATEFQVSESGVKHSYWRHVYHKPYKSNRKPANLSILNTAEAIKKEWVKRGLVLLSQPGFEADDFASLICHTFPDKHKYLMTLDSDWSGLVSETTYWIDTYAQQKKYFKAGRLTILDTARMLDRFNNHKDFKGRYLLEKPSDIWRAKYELGDKSDVIGGDYGCSDIRLIDLSDPIIRPTLPNFTPNKLNTLQPNLRCDMFGLPNLEWV